MHCPLDINWTYILSSEDALDIFWTFYARLFEVLFPRGWSFDALPYKHTTCLPRWNNVKTTVSTSWCLVGKLVLYHSFHRRAPKSQNVQLYNEGLGHSWLRTQKQQQICYSVFRKVTQRCASTFAWALLCYAKRFSKIDDAFLGCGSFCKDIWNVAWRSHWKN